MHETNQVWRHKVRGTTYRIIGTAIYLDDHAAVEGQVISIEVDKLSGLWIARLATADGPVNHASLQAAAPVGKGDFLVLYQSNIPDEDERIPVTFLRPLAEFHDGRFELVPVPTLALNNSKYSEAEREALMSLGQHILARGGDRFTVGHAKTILDLLVKLDRPAKSAAWRPWTEFDLIDVPGDSIIDVRTGSDTPGGAHVYRHQPRSNFSLGGGNIIAWRYAV